MPRISGDVNGTLGYQTLITKGIVYGVYGNLNPLYYPSASVLLKNDDNWRGMQALKERANARFIINIPTHYNLWRAVGRDLIDKARSVLGESIMGFELGNEPNACEWQQAWEGIMGVFEQIS